VSDQETDRQDRATWLWISVAAGAVAGAVVAIWLAQYRKPDRSMDRLLRRCSDRLDTIEESVATLISPPQ
jgi:hypothetical protein